MAAGQGGSGWRLSLSACVLFGDHDDHSSLDPGSIQASLGSFRGTPVVADFNREPLAAADFLCHSKACFVVNGASWEEP